jgi:glycosyltransferase involved in cell wall biosynthesis
MSDLTGLRVAILSPITWRTPPIGYGPLEQVSSNLAEGLRRRGVDVTLFASGDSRTTGTLSSVTPVHLMADPALNGDVYTSLHIGSLFARAREFDLIHNHFDWKPLTYALATQAPPMLTTVHGFTTPPELAAYYAGAQRSFYCSISDADRDPGLSYLATTYNGIDPEAFTFVDRPGDYLVYFARFHPQKGARLAVEIAKRANIRLKMAGIISNDDEAYFKEFVEPHIDGDRVQFLGHVEGKERDDLLGGALALVHMTTQPERFGLALIEAGACGTPILGARMGSLPEIIVDGVTGFLCDDIDDAITKIPLLSRLKRSDCRRLVEEDFSLERMTDRYCDAYRKALQIRTPPAPSPEQMHWRAHDFWDRPMAFSYLPPRPRRLPE